MKKYIVALQVGGLMEDPEISYADGQLIEAKNKKEAVEIYNKKNNCSFYYGDVVANKFLGKWFIIDCKISKYQLEFFLKSV